jgi:2-methylisocitrate lyase-like PEP mutase family enzyme
MIMARTDACATQGFEAAIERAQRMSEAGADILFVEAVTRPEEVRALPKRLDKPQLMNMVVGGKTPIFDAAELSSLGYAFVLYANAALQGALAGMTRVLTTLREQGRVDEDPKLLAPFAERQRLVGKGEWDALEARYRT